MNTPRDNRPANTRETPARETASTPQRAWTRPEFTEIAVCAEICAYVHRA